MRPNSALLARRGSDPGEKVDVRVPCEQGYRLVRDVQVGPTYRRRGAGGGVLKCGVARVGVYLDLVEARSRGLDRVRHVQLGVSAHLLAGPVTICLARRDHRAGLIEHREADGVEAISRTETTPP